MKQEIGKKALKTGYEPPRAISLSDAQVASGARCALGASATNACQVGSVAITSCGNGGRAGTSCSSGAAPFS
jgi:hypothetical protein